MTLLRNVPIRTKFGRQMQNDLKSPAYTKSMISQQDYCIIFYFQFLSISLYYTPCLEKTVQICFCQNFVKFRSILIIFGRKMTKRLKLYEVHSFSTSPNSSRHHTTVLNADVPKCYRTLIVDICKRFIVSTQ